MDNKIEPKKRTSRSKAFNKLKQQLQDPSSVDGCKQLKKELKKKSRTRTRQRKKQGQGSDEPLESSSTLSSSSSSSSSSSTSSDFQSASVPSLDTIPAPSPLSAPTSMSSPPPSPGLASSAIFKPSPPIDAMLNSPSTLTPLSTVNLSNDTAKMVISGKRRRRSSPTGPFLSKSSIQSLAKNPVFEETPPFANAEYSNFRSKFRGSKSYQPAIPSKPALKILKRNSDKPEIRADDCSTPQGTVAAAPSLYLGSFSLTPDTYQTPILPSTPSAPSAARTASKQNGGDSSKDDYKGSRLYERVTAEFLIEPSNVTSMLRVPDLRDLVLYLLANGRAPSWIGIKKSFAIHRVVSIYIPSLSPSLFGLDINNARPQAFDSSLNFFQQNFSHAWVVESPGNKYTVFSPTDTFLYMMANSHDRSVMKNDTKANHSPKEPRIKCLPADMILTLEELISNKYPIHPATTGAAIASSQNPEILEPPGDEWVDTVELSSPSIKQSPNVFGIDCEMCDTLHGKELTRITIVDLNGEVVLDELVKPDNEIQDYLTQYSGITAEMLAPITTRLADIQEKILRLISTTDVIIGHSLENDLNALKLRHPCIIDTAIIYHSQTSIYHKPSLRNLAKSFLKRDIQMGQNGHDSVEDAMTCIDLLQLKLKHGLTFGHQHTDGKISLSERLSNVQPRNPNLRQVAVVDYGVPFWACSSAQTIISCTNDDEVVRHSAKSAEKHSFTWARFRELELLSQTAQSARRFRPPPSKPSEAQASEQSGEVSSEEVSLEEQSQEEKALSEQEGNPSSQTSNVVSQSHDRLGERLKRLYKSLPANTAVMIWTGQGDKQKMMELNAKRQQYQYEYRTKNWKDIHCEWTDHDAQALYHATEVARRGLAFFTVKKA